MLIVVSGWWGGLAEPDACERARARRRHMVMGRTERATRRKIVHSGSRGVWSREVCVLLTTKRCIIWLKQWNGIWTLQKWFSTMVDRWNTGRWKWVCSANHSFELQNLLHLQFLFFKIFFAYRSGSPLSLTLIRNNNRSTHFIIIIAHSIHELFYNMHFFSGLSIGASFGEEFFASLYTMYEHYVHLLDLRYQN